MIKWNIWTKRPPASGQEKVTEKASRSCTRKSGCVSGDSICSTLLGRLVIQNVAPSTDWYSNSVSVQKSPLVALIFQANEYTLYTIQFSATMHINTSVWNHNLLTSNAITWLNFLQTPNPNSICNQGWPWAPGPPVSCLRLPGAGTKGLRRHTHWIWFSNGSRAPTNWATSTPSNS